MLGVGLGVALLSCIIGTYFDQAIWIIWIGLARIGFACYEKNNRLVQLLLPLGFLWLFVGSFVKLHEKVGTMRKLNDRPIVEFFQKADREGKKNLFLSKEELEAFGISLYSWGLYPDLPRVLYELRLISKPIKIYVVTSVSEE